MRVASWNIWSKGSELRPRHWLAAADYLVGQQPHLVALQEIDCRWGERSDWEDVSGEMAQRLRYECLFCPSIRDGSRQYGNAILSRSAMLETGQIVLSPNVAWDRDNHETEPRTAAWARVEQPRPTVLVSVHLANALHFASTPITGTQASTLAGLVQQLQNDFPKHLLVLAGDFNLPPEAPEIKQLDALLPRQGPAEPTWPVHSFSYHGWQEEPPPKYCVDHLFSSRPARVWLGKSRVSDHLPLLAEFPPA